MLILFIIFNKDKETGEDVYYPPKDTYNELVQAKTPSGTPAYFHTIALEGAYTVVKNLELNGTLRWTIADGKKKGMRFRFLQVLHTLFGKICGMRVLITHAHQNDI